MHDLLIRVIGVFLMNTDPIQLESSIFPPLLKIEDVVNITQLSRSTVNRKASDPDDDFPASFNVSSNSVRWMLQDVVAWIELMKQGGKS